MASLPGMGAPMMGPQPQPTSQSAIDQNSLNMIDGLVRAQQGRGIQQQPGGMPSQPGIINNGPPQDLYQMSVPKKNPGQ